MSLTSFILPYLPAFAQEAIGRVKESPLGYRLVHGAFWSLFGAVASRILSLASSVIVARLLGKAGLGQFAIIQSTVGMFGIFAGFGLGQTTTKYVAELREKDPDRAGRIMGMGGLMAAFTGTLMAAILFVFAPWLAANTLADPGLAPLLRLGSLILIFEAMNGAQMGALAGLEAFRLTASINIAVGVASFPMTIIGVYYWGLEGSVWALTANRALNWLLNHIALRRESKRLGLPFVLRGSKAELPILWNYSLPSMLSGVMVAPTLWICNAMLVNQLGGYEQMGILAAAISFQQILYFLGNSLSAPLLPMLANILGSGMVNERFARINILSTWFLGALPAVFLFGLPEIAETIFGKQFKSQQFTYTFLLSVFCASVVIYKQGLARVLAAHGLMWWGTLSNMVWAVLFIGGTWLLISYGSVGYAIAWACAYVLNTIIFIPLYICKRLVPKGTIVSPEAGLIWMVLLGGMGLNFLHVSIIWRLAFIPIAATTVCWMFWRLLISRDNLLLDK